MTPYALLAQYEKLNAAGWTVLTTCIVFVCGLCVFCYYRVLREPQPSKHHPAPLDIDTRDQDT